MKRPFLYITISFSLGIILASVIEASLILFLTLSFIFLIAAIALLLTSRKWSHSALYLSMLFLGASVYVNSNILQSDHVLRLITADETPAVLKGAVIDDPVMRKYYDSERQSFLLKVNAFKKDTRWVRASGIVKTNLYGASDKLSYGDEVVLEGSLSKPGMFSVNQGRVAAMPDASSGSILKSLHNIREKAISLIDIKIDKRYSPFVKAILIGDRSDLKYRITEDFIKTGTVHVIAISGLHVGLIAAFFLWIFTILKIPRKPGLILTTFLIILYAVIVGPQAPILRAVIMFTICVIGYIIGRESDIINSLMLAAFIILVLKPNSLFDAGFQLSFISVLSIVIISPRLEELVKQDDRGKAAPRRGLGAYIIKATAVSFAAWIGVAPLVAFYFNIVPFAALIANLVIVPLSFFIIIEGIFFLAISPLLPQLSGLLITILEPTVKMTFLINSLLTRTPLSYIRVPAPSMIFFFLYYATILVLLVPESSFPAIRRVKIRKSFLLILLLLVFNIHMIVKLCDPERRFLRLTFLDVGQGDACLIEFPSGGNMLIDASTGGSDDAFDAGRAVIAPHLWNKGIRQIDALFITHFHEDHLGGAIYLIKNFRIGCVIDNGLAPEPGNRLYKIYEGLIKKKGIRRIVVKEGSCLKGFPDADIFILNPMAEESTDSNDNSIVLKLAHKNSWALFCGDITAKTMARLLEYGRFLKCDVLKVPHHGGALGERNIVERFFLAASPKYSIISVGRRNKFGAPAKETLDIITNCNSICYKTKDDGNISIVSDNYRWWKKDYERKN